jgi:hypothetical protein
MNSAKPINFTSKDKGKKVKLLQTLSYEIEDHVKKDNFIKLIETDKEKIMNELIHPTLIEKLTQYPFISKKGVYIKINAPIEATIIKVGRIVTLKKDNVLFKVDIHTLAPNEIEKI